MPKGKAAPKGVLKKGVLKKPAAAQPEPLDTQGGERDESPEPNIDRAKVRKLKQCFDQLPEDVQEEYKELRGKPGKQRRVTQLINDSIVRSGLALSVISKPSRWFESSFNHKSSKYKDEWGAGMLREMAEKKMGGKDALDKAIYEGRAQRQTTGAGIEMVFLPKAAIGKREQFDHTRTGKEKEKLKNDTDAMQAFEDLHKAVTEGDWVVPTMTQTSFKDLCGGVGYKGLFMLVFRLGQVRV